MQVSGNWKVDNAIVLATEEKWNGLLQRICRELKERQIQVII